VTQSQHNTFPPIPLFADYVDAGAVIDDYFEDLLLPAFNELRRANGIAPAPLPDRAPVTEEAALAAGKKYKAYWRALRADCNEKQQPRKPRKPPTLASVAKQASKAALDVARYEVKPDGTVVAVTGAGEQHQGNQLDEWIAKHARAPERHS